ncbi:BlaI/MecI/CopY family transcriptional regulator [Longirhabdus pacifica]|uniref:BlaI/MecI/CopY family transcriptional regulator n=1 Tax=Longirhabdus pacifica TaxID=2305227 RepID=UPI001008EA9F|nr:BlaI/MecI/CopY family transcriptional regulator [Longirhabdus pacifica]
MSKMKRLPDAEFEIMKVIWKHDPPITTSLLMKQLGEDKEWEAQTLISLLKRLVEREFLRTEKKGKERTYYPLITEETYIKFETGNFMERFHENSFMSLINTLHRGKKLRDADLDDLSSWLKDRDE